jgi:hypothetical protein
MKYMNYLILIIIILLLLYNIHKRQYTQIESFLLGSTTSLTSSSIDDSKYNYKAQQETILNTLNNNNQIFDEFCEKLNHINNNFNDYSRNLLNLNNVYINKINLKKKQSNNLIQEILDLQKNIYNNDEELSYRKKYETQSNQYLKNQIKILSSVINNLDANKENQNKLLLKVN